ncbi:copper transport protein ATOX1-like [Saccoglossus kowalevskii]
MTSQKHEFKVELTCDGCSSTVEQELSALKSDGVTDFKVDLAAKRVYIDSTLTCDELLKILQKTGKCATYECVSE